MPLFRRASRLPRPIVGLAVVPLGNFTELLIEIDAAEPNALEGRDLVLTLHTAGGPITLRARLSRRTNLEFDAGRAVATLILARGHAGLRLTGWRAVVEASRRRHAPIAVGEGEIAPEARVLVA